MAGNDSGENNTVMDSRDDGSLIKATSDEKGKMFVGGLSWETDATKLRTYFEQFGAVRDSVISKEKDTGRHRGFGFILFADPASVDKVINHRQHELDGKNIDPKRARPLRKDNKLFVGGLNPDTSDDTIKAYFKQFGEIEELERPLDHFTKKARGFCFITFTEDGIIGTIISQGKFHNIDGRQCECKDGKPKRNTQAGGQSQNQYPPAYGGFPQWGAAGQWYDPSYMSYGGYGGANAGYGGYGSYAGYGGYGGYGGYAAGYGGYGGGYGGEAYAAQQNQQNTGGKTKSAGRGGQNNYRPY